MLIAIIIAIDIARAQRVLPYIHSLARDSRLYSFLPPMVVCLLKYSTMSFANNVMLSAFGDGISLFAAGKALSENNIISENEVPEFTTCAKGGGISIVNFAQQSSII